MKEWCHLCHDGEDGRGRTKKNSFVEGGFIMSARLEGSGCGAGGGESVSRFGSDGDEVKLCRRMGDEGDSRLTEVLVGRLVAMD